MFAIVYRWVAVILSEMQNNKYKDTERKNATKSNVRM